jgi:hypothetical protein
VVFLFSAVAIAFIDRIMTVPAKPAKAPGDGH